MTAEAASIVRIFHVGKHTCTLTLQQPRKVVLTHAVVEWDPDLPAKLSPAEKAQYDFNMRAAIMDALSTLK